MQRELRVPEGNFTQLLWRFFGEGSRRARIQQSDRRMLRRTSKRCQRMLRGRRAGQGDGSDGMRMRLAYPRRAVTGLTLFGGFASTVFWPLSHSLSHAWGWRATLLNFALLHQLVCIPIHWLAIPDVRPIRSNEKATAIAARSSRRSTFHVPRSQFRRSDVRVQRLIRLHDLRAGHAWLRCTCSCRVTRGISASNGFAVSSSALNRGTRGMRHRSTRT